MVKEPEYQAPALYAPSLSRGNTIEYRRIYTPLPEDSKDPFLRFLEENRDSYGHLYLFSQPKAVLTPSEEKAALGIQTLVGLGLHNSPFSSFTETTRILLYFLSASESASERTTFLQQEFGVRHVEAGWTTYPFTESQGAAYKLFTNATALYEKLGQRENPPPGPTWRDMEVLEAYHALASQAVSPSAHNIQLYFGMNSLDTAAITASLLKLQTLGEIPRHLRQRRHTFPSAIAHENDNQEAITTPHKKTKRAARIA